MRAAELRKMKKSRPKAPGRSLRRNPLARALASPKFRPRVVKKPGEYRRRPKHLRPTDDET
jgi:hypothetical protein